MHSWFDIKSLKIGDEDAGGIKAAATTLNSLIQEEIAAGTASERIVIGGFSQGGATAVGHIGSVLDESSCTCIV